VLADAGSVVEPSVSRAKFDREVARYRLHERDYRARGWWLLEAEYPKLFFVMVTPRLKPPAIAFGALFDFTDYDLQPPSLRLVDPFTKVPYAPRELPTVLKRRVPLTAEQIEQARAQGQDVAGAMIEQRMMMWHSDDDVPFFCLPGVREYHEHPAHTGDPWLLRRGRGEGLIFLLEQLDRYGLAPIVGYQIGVVTDQTQFGQAEVPT